MLRILQRRQKGFTLIELLIVVAIIGVIAALLIPNFLDALNKAKQKRTVADIRNLGTAMMSWLTDQVGAAAAGQLEIDDFVPISDSALDLTLVPQYIPEIPVLDGWKCPGDFYLDTNPLAEHVCAIRSRGRDCTPDGSVYSVGPFEPSDYDRDIVWADGYFVRWPQAQK